MSSSNIVLDKNGLTMFKNLIKNYIDTSRTDILPMSYPEMLFSNVSSMSYYFGFDSTHYMLNELSSVNAVINEDIVDFPFVSKNVKTLSLPNCKYLNGFVGYYSSSNDGNGSPIMVSGQVSFSSISLPECIYINNFYIDKTATDSLQYLNLPKCKILYGISSSGNNFISCTQISSVSLPECRFISGAPFLGFGNLSRIELPKCEFIGSPYTFNKTVSGQETWDLISLPKIKSLAPFNVSVNSLYIGGIKNLSSPNFSITGYVNNLFLPDVVDFSCLDTFLMYNNQDGMTISLPKCINFGLYGSSSNLIKSLYLPNCQDFYMEHAMVVGNISLPKAVYVTLLSCYGINNYSLYLMGSSVATLRTSFRSSSYIPKSIIVPKSLYTAYKSASIWSSYSSKIFSA